MPPCVRCGGVLQDLARRLTTEEVEAERMEEGEKKRRKECADTVGE